MTPFFKVFSYIVLGTVLTLAAAGFISHAGAADLQAVTDNAPLPHEKPLSATGFVCVVGDKQPKLVAVVFTYPSGKLVRVDIDHMHGLADASELSKYAQSADDQKVYAVGCVAPDVT
jgi:hypothetical protein